MLTTKQNYDEAKAFALTPAKQARRIKQLLAQAARHRRASAQCRRARQAAAHGRGRAASP